MCVFACMHVALGKKEFLLSPSFKTTAITHESFLHRQHQPYVWNAAFGYTCAAMFFKPRWLEKSLIELNLDMTLSSVCVCVCGQLSQPTGRRCDTRQPRDGG